MASAITPKISLGDFLVSKLAATSASVPIPDFPAIRPYDLENFSASATLRDLTPITPFFPIIKKEKTARYFAIASTRNTKVLASVIFTEKIIPKEIARDFERTRLCFSHVGWGKETEHSLRVSRAPESSIGDLSFVTIETIIAQVFEVVPRENRSAYGPSGRVRV